MHALNFKSDETFRGDFRFRNSDAAILRFPFPFPSDRYMYSVNIEPHVRSGPTAAYEAVFDIDEHYIAECNDRALTLAADPKRCQVLPHMVDAEWDTLELLMESLSIDYPDHFSFSRAGDDCTWINRPLGITEHFVFGKGQTLPCGPFEYITRQAQGDFTIQDQREGDLWLDGGMVTSQADWSLDFNLGMPFKTWHGPVPKAHEMGVFDRAFSFLLKLPLGQPVRRLNWTMTINPRLDTSPETYPHWGPDRLTVTPENAGQKVFLRVELQTLFRLPRSNAILFGIRCYLISLEDLARVPKWGKRLHRVLRDLDPALVDYKGLTRFHPLVVDWLARRDDGAELTPGTAPEQSAL